MYIYVVAGRLPAPERDAHSTEAHNQPTSEQERAGLLAFARDVLSAPGDQCAAQDTLRAEGDGLRDVVLRFTPDRAQHVREVAALTQLTGFVAAHPRVAPLGEDELRYFENIKG